MRTCNPFLDPKAKMRDIFSLMTHCLKQVLVEWELEGQEMGEGLTGWGQRCFPGTRSVPWPAGRRL